MLSTIGISTLRLTGKSSILRTSFRSITSTSPLLNSDDTGSHSDFGAQKKSVPTGNSQALELIESHVKTNPIMLYMKGSPNAPQCGFSARVVGVLQEHGASFSSVNVLEYPAIREGIKEYSDWPTIPQLYVNGEFVGGCDIVMQMSEDGELEELLKAEE